MPRSISQAEAALIFSTQRKTSVPHCKWVIRYKVVGGTVPSKAGRNPVCLLYCSINPALAKTVQTQTLGVWRLRVQLRKKRQATCMAAPGSKNEQ